MASNLTCVSFNILTTSKCTLKCSNCSWSFPQFKTPMLADADKTIASLEKVFLIYNFAQEVRFDGAEAFLYPDIQKLMIALAKYKSQFGTAIIVTNGTYIPQLSIIETMKQLPYKIIVRIDNYGVLSGKTKELIEILTKNGIEVDERIYYGDDQAFGGWIDYGNYRYKGYSEEALREIFYKCRLPDDCTFLLNDEITTCCYATAGALLGKVQKAPREIISLSGEESIDELRKRVQAWRDEPFEACKYCNGFDPVNSPRIPAAEQLEE